MITVLTGDNSFELQRALSEIVVLFDGRAEQFDGNELELSQLADLLSGTTLFADKRLVIIKDISDNKPLWDRLPEWLLRISDDVHLVLVEAKPDKRTKTYKVLVKDATFNEFKLWSDYDVSAAERWVVDESKRLNATIDNKSAQLIVARVGLNQWHLIHALEKLSVLEEINPKVINEVIEANPVENVFNLLDVALNGNHKKVIVMIKALQRTQDPYMTFGLLAGQVFQLATLSLSNKDTNKTAADIGVHPYALSKLAKYSKDLGRSKIRNIVRQFADTDIAMKSGTIDPWLLIETTLIKTASL